MEIVRDVIDEYRQNVTETHCDKWLAPIMNKAMLLEKEKEKHYRDLLGLMQNRKLPSTSKHWTSRMVIRPTLHLDLEY